MVNIWVPTENLNQKCDRCIKWSLLIRQTLTINWALSFLLNANKRSLLTKNICDLRPFFCIKDASTLRLPQFDLTLSQMIEAILHRWPRKGVNLNIEICGVTIIKTKCFKAWLRSATHRNTYKCKDVYQRISVSVCTS